TVPSFPGLGVPYRPTDLDRRRVGAGRRRLILAAESGYSALRLAAGRQSHIQQHGSGGAERALQGSVKFARFFNASRLDAMSARQCAEIQMGQLDSRQLGKI